MAAPTEKAPNPATGSGAPEPSDKDLVEALGRQVRRFRKSHELSVSDLAARAGISAGMLSKIENGGISASLTTLQAIASALQVPISALFAAYEDRADCSFVAKGQGLTIERSGTKAGHVYQLLGHMLRGEVAVEPYLITLKANAAPFTAFQHAGVEFIHMLKGDVTYRHGGETYRLKAGDSLLFDSGAPHGPERISAAECQYLSIIIYPRPQA